MSTAHPELTEALPYYVLDRLDKVPYGWALISTNDQTIVRANDKFTDMLGFIQDPAGQRVGEVNFRLSRELSATPRGESRTIETSENTYHNLHLWYRICHHDRQDAPRAYTVTVWNQTEQAQTKHRLKRLQNYYNEYVEATNSEVLRLELQRLFLIQDTRPSTQRRILERDLYVADANSRFMEAANLDRRDVIGEPLTKFLPAASSLDSFFSRFVKNNFEVSNYIAPIVLPSGERRMYRHSMHAHCNSGLLVRVWYTREDVTDQQNRIVDAYRAAQQERNRISNVLHDKLASSLSGTGYALQCIIAMLDQKDPDLSSAQDTLTQIQDEVMKSTKETRHLSHSLSPVKMERDGLIDTIRSFLDSKESLHEDITFHFHHEGDPNDITDTSISDLIHMITSQAITNSIAHAQASEIHVDLLIDINSVRLEVTDDGTGLEDSQLWNAEGIGMMSMRHRVEARGGSFSLESTFNLGTTITAIVPLLT